ncbi:hypothetical protein HJG60_008569 [Phyllostomus discolor]|uniref:Uncharacterized protein n=1 Tax=Phyllostomus discolor TaxID=89673 RepID=A0A834DNJ1_9CHIR|nr:hypothetical protein HJG60_008569 [Phyllostomus discolor]
MPQPLSSLGEVQDVPHSDKGCSVWSKARRKNRVLLLPGTALTSLFSKGPFGNKHEENTIITKIKIHAQHLHGRDYIQVKDVCNPVCRASNITRRPVHLHRVSLQHLGVCSIKILPWWEKTDFQMVTLLIQ